MEGDFSIKHNKLLETEFIKNKTPMVINTTGVIFVHFLPSQEYSWMNFILILQLL